MPGEAPLFLASAAGDAEECRRLIQEEGGLVDRAEANNNVDYLDGWTPLIVAARNGHDAVVRVLLDHGASINLAKKNDATALHSASFNGREAVVRVLLDRGASINQAENDGATPLFIACLRGHEAAVRMLARAGADLDLRDNYGYNAQDVAREEEHPHIADWLAASRGSTPLHFACDARDHDGILALLRSDDGVEDIHAVSNAGRTALQVAQSADVPMALPLCAETARLMEWATSPWSPATHRVWPASFRNDGVITVLCVAKYAEGRFAMPKELWQCVLSFCSRRHFIAAP